MFYFNLDVLNQSYFFIAVETLNFLKICTLRKDEFRFYMMSPNIAVAIFSWEKLREKQRMGRKERDIFTQGREYLEGLLINWGKHQCDAYCLGAIIIKTFNIDTVFVL